MIAIPKLLRDNRKDRRRVGYQGDARNRPDGAFKRDSRRMPHRYQRELRR